MPRITFIDGDVEIDVEANVGDSLMQAAVEASVDGIIAECGGSCSCATCHVTLSQGWYEKLGAPEGIEAGMLEFSEEVHPTSRLSCQITVCDDMDGMVVNVVPSY